MAIPGRPVPYMDLVSISKIAFVQILSRPIDDVGSRLRSRAMLNARTSGSGLKELRTQWLAGAGYVRNPTLSPFTKFFAFWIFHLKIYKILKKNYDIEKGTFFSSFHLTYRLKNWKERKFIVILKFYRFIINYLATTSGSR